MPIPSEALPLPIAKALLLALPSADSGGTLAFVHVTCENGTYTCEATNGKWLVQIVHTPEGDPRERNDVDVLVPQATLKTYIASKGHAPLTTDGDIRDFPDLSQVIPRHGGGEYLGVIGLDARYMMDANASIKHLFSQPKSVTVAIRWQFNGPFGPIRVDAVSPALARVPLDSAMWILMPMRLD